MPVYEYFCEICGEEKEVQQKVSDPPPNCERPDCDNSPMTKKISKTSFSLKGKWFKQGY